MATQSLWPACICSYTAEPTEWCFQHQQPALMKRTQGMYAFDPEQVAAEVRAALEQMHGPMPPNTGKDQVRGRPPIKQKEFEARVEQEWWNGRIWPLRTIRQKQERRERAAAKKRAKAQTWTPPPPPSSSSPSFLPVIVPVGFGQFTQPFFPQVPVQINMNMLPATQLSQAGQAPQQTVPELAGPSAEGFDGMTVASVTGYVDGDGDSGLGGGPWEFDAPGFTLFPPEVEEEMLQQAKEHPNYHEPDWVSMCPPFLGSTSP